MMTMPVVSAARTRLPGVDQAHTHDAVERGGDAGIVEVEAGGLDGGHVDLHRALGLADEGDLIVDLLGGHEVALAQRAEAFEVALAGLELGAVASQRPLGLVELDLEGAGVDLREGLTPADGLALAEEDLVEAAVDLGAHRDLLPGGDRAQAFEPDRDVALLDRGDEHRHGAWRVGAGYGGSLRAGGGRTGADEIKDGADRGRGHEKADKESGGEFRHMLGLGARATAEQGARQGLRTGRQGF